MLPRCCNDVDSMFSLHESRVLSRALRSSAVECCESSTSSPQKSPPYRKDVLHQSVSCVSIVSQDSPRAKSQVPLHCDDRFSSSFPGSFSPDFSPGFSTPRSFTQLPGQNPALGSPSLFCFVAFPPPGVRRGSDRSAFFGFLINLNLFPSLLSLGVCVYL